MNELINYYIILYHKMLSLLYNKKSSLKFIGNISNRNLLIEINATIIIVFFLLYYNFVPSSDFHKPGDERTMNALDYLYFTMITHSTIGYGVISPKSSIGKTLVICHVISMLLFNIILFS